MTRIAVSGLLVYFALNFVNMGTVASRLSRIDPVWIALELPALLAQIIVVTMRWQLIMGRCGADVPLRQLFRITMISMFFNQTLPSSIGGDAMRIWLVAKKSSWRIATYSVLLDRVVGVVALAILVVICLPWTLDLVRNPIGRGALLVIGFGSVAAALGFISLAWERLHLLQRWSVTRHLVDAAAVAVSILRSPSVLAPVSILSLLSHLLTVIIAWLAARSVNADLSLLNALFLVLPVVLVAIVPISIAGWGVREGAMVAAFAYAGLSQGDGLLVSLLFGAASLALGAVGGLIWVTTTTRTDRRALPDKLAGA